MKPNLRPNIVGQWDTFGQWVNRATLDIGPMECARRYPRRELMLKEYPRAICVDSQGRRCFIGADFERARDEKAFPVYYFWDCVQER